MASLSVTAPDNYVATIVAAVRHEYGDNVAALSDANAVRYAIRAHLLKLVRRHQKLVATSSERTAADAAYTDAQTAEATARQALQDAIDAALAQVDTDFEQVS